MELQHQLFIGAIVGFFNLLLNAGLTKELLIWEPSLGKRISLILAVWLIPVVGAFIAYRHLELDWLKKQSNKSGDSKNVVSGALLELDAIFNPGQRHVIEARQKENLEVNEDGQRYKNDREDIAELEKSRMNESSDR